MQNSTPDPGTPITRDFLARDLVASHDIAEYDGTTAVTRNAHMAAEDIEFMRWKAERWMKVRHIPAVFRHDPRFVLANGRRMLAHTFRGSSWRSALGLESVKAAFHRYRALRAHEREYL